jgi:phenylpropionate dioxygenase-like ring-hydroxylating dioxygenase large terminal subunit
MNTATEFLRNTWYVAAWSDEIAGGRVLARTITHVPLIFWRDATGKVVALEDRCCHRAAPLSKGRLEDAGWRGRPGYMHYEANYLLITDNLLDFSHLSYVHETTLGGSPKYAGIRPKITRSDRGVRVERWLLDDAPAPFIGKLKTWPGNVDRWNIYEVVLPGVLLMDSGSAPTGTGAPQGLREDAAQFFGCQAVTPETERTSHYFFQQSHGFALDDPGVTDRLTESVLEGFMEDKDIILAQQRVLDLNPGVPMLAMRMDIALEGFRSTLQKAIARERTEIVISGESP